MVNENEVITIKLDDIIPNRFQPREVFDDQSMQELAESIKAHGVIQPIIVRPVDNKYEIIAGERRYKASVMAGKTDIPALVRNKDDKDSSIIAFIENSQRKDMTAIEEARTCERILTNNDITQEQLAKQLGMSQSTLANKLRLLTLPIEIQESLLHGEISERHARSLLSIKDTRKQLDLLDKVKNEKLTVRELDGVIKSMLEEANKDGLYNLPGSDEYKESNATTDTVMDFSRYENPVEEPASTSSQTDNQFDNFLNNINSTSVVNEPAPSVQEEKKEENKNEFLSFLNNFDESKLVPAEEQPKEEVKVETPTTGESNNEFLSFLNSFDENKLVPAEEQPKEEVKVETPTTEETNNEFLSFLNNFDESKLVPAEEQPTENTSIPETNGTSQEINIPTETKEDKSFDEFLSSFNSGIESSKPEEVKVEDVKEETPLEEKTNNEFLSFINNFDESKVVPAVEVPKEEVKEVDKGFVDFMQKYEAPVETPVDLGPIEEMKPAVPPVEEKIEEAVYDPNSKYLNPIEEVAPKTEYVENSPSYVDITKPISYDSVDSIIGKLKVVTDEIKKSKYKITTEETDFDDVYTITIKIDKRNFL